MDLCVCLIYVVSVFVNTRVMEKSLEYKKVVGNIMMTDPIADMLIRIKNAYRAGHATMVVPRSVLKLRIAALLVEQRCLRGVEEHGRTGRELLLTLHYPEAVPSVRDVRRVSKPGSRIYVDEQHIPRLQPHFGFAIISTSKGLMTGSSARKAGMGGEVLGLIFKK